VSISFWPQTLTWQLIFILMVFFAIKKSYQLWKNYQDNAYRREALAWLGQCSLSSKEDIRQLPALLRKTALLANELCRHDEDKSKKSTLAITRHHEIIGLSGKAWATWLDNNCRQSQFNQISTTLSQSPITNEKLLVQLAYLPKLELNDSQFINAIKQLSQQIEIWIKHHKLNDDSQHNNLGGKE